MARSPTGTFTLVAGNPVVTGTLITSDWANTTMPDIGAALTDSLSRTGQGGMLAPIRGVSGSVTAPAHSFTDFPRSGMYAVSADEMRYAVNGVDRMRWQAGGLPTQTYNVATGLWEDLEPVGVVGPNLLDNSNFQIHQRGSVFSGAHNEHTLDRWHLRSGAGDSLTAVNPTQTIPFPYAQGVYTSGGNFIFSQRKPIRLGAEGSVFDYSGKTFTVSGFITSSITQYKTPLMAIYLYHAGGQAQLVTQEYVEITPQTWGSTFTIPDLSGYSVNADSYLEFRFFNLFPNDTNIPSGTIFGMSKFKLEEGNVFTGYEPTPYAIDEAECMKWLYIPDTSFLGYGYKAKTPLVSDIGMEGWTLDFPTMYANPDVTYTGHTAEGCSFRDFNRTRSSAVMRVDVGASADTKYRLYGGTLILSCEL